MLYRNEMGENEILSCLVCILANTPGGAKRSEQMFFHVGDVDINCN